MGSHSGQELFWVLLFGGGLVGISCAPKLKFGEGTPAHCSNQVVDGSETDVDCGGPECGQCGTGRHCLGSDDCTVGSCAAGICQAAHCLDGELSGDESDIDCGGLECLGCEPGQSCRRASDCSRGSCDTQARICEGAGGAPGTGGGSGTGGEVATGGSGRNGGEPATGGEVTTAGGIAGGGTTTGGAPIGGSLAGAGGETAGGSLLGGQTSGGAGSGGESSGGIATGGVATGGESSGGTVSGGAPTGGAGAGGVAGALTGGVPTGGAPTGGAPTGGAPTGGAPTGGAPTGGAPTGGVGTGGLPPGITLIDFLDEANDVIELQDGEGQWYTFHDRSTTGVITPDTPRDAAADVIPVALPTPRGGSLLGVHVVANDGFTEWGAGVGFNLNSPDPTIRRKYDVSSYTGLDFWARSGSGTVSLRVKLVTADIAPTTDPGGECTQSCNDAFGYAIDLTTAWREYSIPFSSLTQQGWGATPPGGFDPTGVLTVQLHVDTGVPFDIWLDDVGFY